MEHSKFTPKHALQLAAPHTWSAAVVPVAIAVSCAVAQGFPLDAPLAALLLVISVLMQSSVNALNDYFDFVNGADSADDNLEASDATLLSEGIDPKCALWLSVGLLAVAFALGLYVIWCAGWIPLAIAAVGALMVVLYSGGRTPISYMPIGELVSGFVMGELIALACYWSLTLSLDWRILLWALPCMLTIGLVMMTNNTCDIEKDARAGRRTLPVLLGRDRARMAYRAIVVCALALVVAIVLLWFTRGWVGLLFVAALCLPLAMGLFRNPLTQAARIQAMSLASTFNATLGCTYCLCILLS